MLAKLPTALLLAAIAPVAPAGRAGGASPPAELRYVVFLRPDPARKPLPVEERQRIMSAHMANISSLARDGVLVAAGPMEDKEVTISGIFVFNSPSLAEACRVAALDPTVTAGRNTVDVHPWLGPAGIGTSYFLWKRQNPAGQDQMASHAFCIVKRGPAWIPTVPDDGEHEEFVESLRTAGKLAAAGPIEGDADMLGIVIFKGASLDDARTALEADPPVRTGELSVEYHVWWTADKILPW
jgi:uncharacterized protein YciI